MIYKRFNGKKIKSSADPNWKRARWWMRRSIAGVLIHKALPLARTREEAETAERAEIESRFRRKYGIEESITFKAFARTYARYAETTNRNRAAKRQYMDILNRFFGEKAISEITPQDCRDAQTWCASQGAKGDLSPSSVNRIMSTLSKMFSLAIEEGCLTRNPMAHVGKLEEPAPRRRLLSREESEAFWREVEKDIYLWRLVTIAVNVPVRKGQLLALRVRDVDLTRNLLSVGSSKGRAARVVPLNRTARAVFADLVAEARGEWLFPYHGTGGERNAPARDFGKRWRNALRRAGIADLRFHDLRRVLATSLLSSGVGLDVVQELFAHSSADITRVYAVTEAERMRAALDRLDDVKEIGDQ